MMRNLFPKTINDNNIDLNKFPASKVKQLAMKMESSKATAKHIIQVATDPQAVQIYLMHHQHTELPPSRFQRKQKKHFKSRQDTSKQHYYNEEKHSGHQCTRNMKHMQAQIDVRSVVIHNMLRDLDVQLVSTNVRIVISLVISAACATRRKRESSPKAHQMKIGTVYMQDELCSQSEESSCDASFCLQVKLKSTQAETPAPLHLITNLAYKLKPYKKTQYLISRLDTCSDVNIMPVSVYQLIFKDADCMKLAPSSKLEIATYTADKIKVIGSCTLLVVH